MPERGKLKVPNAHCRLSIVIPMYNEESVVRQTLEEVYRVATELRGIGDFEVVCVDDGSADNTLGVLLDLRDTAAYPNLRILKLSRNFGHQAAVSAGLSVAEGDAVVVMDADLQDDPRILQRFVDEYRNGAEVVYAVRKNRKEPFWLRALYAAHYRLLNALASVKIPVDAGDFCLMSRRVVELLVGMPERRKYLRGLRAWVGFQQVGIPVERRARAAGESKYALRALVGLAADGIMSFSTAPLRLATVLGLAGIALGSLYGAYAILVRIVGGSVPRGFTALTMLVIGLGSLTLLVLGIIGEYLARIYEEVKGRPPYIVEKVWGGEDG